MVNAMPSEMTARPVQASNVDIRVLLVGNVEPEISNMQDFLQHNITPSYRVYHCVDALEATNFLKEIRVDIILLDFGITEKDEAEDIFRIIRHNAKNTPVIIFTGEAELDLALLIINEGATDNLTREKYTASPKSLKDAIEFSLIKKKALSKSGSSHLADISAKSAAELLQIEEKYAAKLAHIEEKAAAELKQVKDKGTSELKEVYAKKLADIEYQKKILSWIGEEPLTETPQPAPPVEMREKV